MVRSTSSTTPFLPSSSRNPSQSPVSRGRDQKSPPQVSGTSTGCALARFGAISKTSPTRKNHDLDALRVAATPISHPPLSEVHACPCRGAKKAAVGLSDIEKAHFALSC